MIEITSALGKIEQVLNHYRAFKDVKEALLVAAEAERMVGEFEIKSAALRQDISDLEVAKGEAGKKNAELRDKGKAALESMVAKMKNVEAGKRADIKAAEDRIEALKVRFSEMERAFIDKVKSAEDRITALRIEANAEIDRFKVAKKSLNDLKEML